MKITIELVVFVVLLVDAIGANLFVWLGGDKWYKKHFRVFSRKFPANKFLAIWYLVLVLFIGYLLVQLGQIDF